MRRQLTFYGMLLLTMLTLSFSAFAQEEATQAPEVPALPIDPAIRMGTLPNGLTYIIRHNEKPKQRANFYIAQRVGSMQEEDNQSGLAHFLEHMAFNGTRNYEGKELINYLESIGVKFGSELNAYTALDETMYTIMDAPVARQGVVDSCLLILRDWSDGIALQEEEIDNERGVIENEWRQRDNGMMRLFTQLLKQAFPGMRYGNRMPIGSMDVVRNFTYQELRDYYHKWYRPDLQGLIIVGDIDVDYVENKIKELYSDLPLDPNAAERVYEEIPDRTEPFSAVLTDPEATATMLSFAFSTDAMPREMKGTVMGFAVDYMDMVVTKMFGERIKEITSKPNAPFVQASMASGPLMGLTVTEDALEFRAIAHEGKYLDALNALVAEMKRVRDFGFTEAEYERARIEIISQYEDQMKSKENRTNTQYATEYGNYFTTGGYIPGIDMEYMLVSQLAPSLNVDAINNYMKQLLASSNFYLYLLAPEKEGLTYPTDAELLSQYQAALEQEVEAYVDQFTGAELMAPEAQPESGEITATQQDEELGITRWTLSNGAEVFLMPTTFKKNDIRLRALSRGGYVMEDGNAIDLRALSDGYATVGGVADFDETALSKVLVGKQVSASTSVSEFSESVSASSSDKDLETMFQLMYLRMTANRKDADAFLSNIQRTKAMLEAAQANPLSVIFRDSLPELMYPGDVMERALTAAELDQINYDKILELQQSRFEDASDFQFFIVGSFDLETIKPYVLKYIASLPSTNSKEPDRSAEKNRMNGENTTKHFFIKADTPTAVVVDIHTGMGEYNLREVLKMTILSEVLDQQFFKSIREEEGGTYGVSTQGHVSAQPEGERALMVFFQTDPESTEKLNTKIKSELEKIAKGEIDITEYFNKTILNKEKQHAQNLEENGYWMDVMINKYYHDRDHHTTYLDTLKSITIEEVEAYLGDVLKSGAYLEMIAKTEKTAAEGHAESGTK